MASGAHSVEELERAFQAEETEVPMQEFTLDDLVGGQDDDDGEIEEEIDFDADALSIEGDDLEFEMI